MSIEKRKKIICRVKIYFYLFCILTMAEILFTLSYYFITKKTDNIILLGAIIYAGSMIIAFITYKVEKYMMKRKELMDALP